MQGLHLNHTTKIITVCCVAFSLLSLTFLHPFIPETSYATNASTSSSDQLSVSLAPSIGVSATDAISTIAPEASGSFTSLSSAVSVSTNNSTGYSLYMSSSSDNVNLVNTNSSSDFVQDITTSTTESELRNNTNLRNHYGFTHDNSKTNPSEVDPSKGEIVTGTYLPVTPVSNNTLIKATDENINISTTNITFSGTLDRNLPAGTYTNEVVFTALANTNPDVFMQDFTAEECNVLDPWSYDSSTSAVHEGDTITLWDKRDNNSYKVRKLADGNCWMVDNLRLDLSTETTLTPDDTNLPSGTTFTPDHNTQTDSTAVIWGTSDDAAAVNQTRSYKAGSGLSGDSQSDNSKFGNYYNWYAVTAGTGTYEMNTDSMAAGDICPRHWQLPPLDSQKSWQYLITSYGINNGTMSLFASSLIFGQPLELVLSGVYRSGLADVNEQHYCGHYWINRTFTYNDKPHGYVSRLSVWSNTVGLWNGSSEQNGNSARCVLSANS